MDSLTDLLDGVRARAALVTRIGLAPDWSVRFTGGAQLTLVSALGGRAWVVTAGETVSIETGDVVVIRGPEPYTVAEQPDTPPSRVITSDDFCVRACGPEPRTCGDPEGETVLLSGAYEGRAGVGERLLTALPDVVVVRGTRDPVFDHAAAAASVDRPGQQAVLDRLLDLALISTLRTWFDGQEARPVDPLVAKALRLLHNDPARAWTVAALAAETGTSRAVLARRFTAAVGRPPMAHLAEWRVERAADLLRETDATVAAIAGKVGYANAFALSAAFKRRRGVTPSEYRA
ncbi:AraC family transcriptional regulator [Actinokineospora auranticolor]|nr:AraC family transcriptional regulator [Actinokineospora auranticolor]